VRIRVLVLLSVVASALVLPMAADAGPDDPVVVGRWGDSFAEPTTAGQPTDEWCVEEAQAGDAHDGRKVTCKPTAGSMAVLGGDDVLYWNALEDMEEVETSVVAEFGAVSIDDQARRLSLAGPTWQPTVPDDGGANGSGYDIDPLLPGFESREAYNDGALFCSSLTFLPDGRVLAAGGTAYYHDPALVSKYGLSELEGLRNSRIYDPATNTWTQGDDMTFGRWYPSLVPLADGKVLVASGVKKLVKTLYPDQPPTDSGRNVVQTETYDPATGTWSENGAAAERSLPLYPRLHLLPNGRVYFNAAGQVFNPNGYAYDELTWNTAAAYDPSSKTWADLGIPGVGTPAPGFRGSTSSIMLPLEPEADGSYDKARFLTAGGILGTTPGTYFAVTDARVDTVDTTTMSLSSQSTGSLNQARWYGTGVLTPTGEVLMFSGANADEVAFPGTGIPVTRPEMWDPATGTWTTLAAASEQRTYHNTAALLPDGRILVGGHAPIATLYGNNTTLVPGVTTPQETRNPTFEIFEPPYLFRGTRPAIKAAPTSLGHGGTFEVKVDVPAEEIDSVLLVRRTALTHLVDGGQRAVELPVVARQGKTLTVAAPPNSAVAPAGPYMLFVNRSTAEGLVPSVAADVTVAGSGAAVAATVATSGTSTSAEAAPAGGVARPATRPAVDLDEAGAVPVEATLAFHEIAEVSGIPHRHGSHGHTAGDVAWRWLPVAAVLAVLANVAPGLRRRLGRSSLSR
jgi:hypothetical protein